MRSSISPVAGVILMIAITTIFAAVIAAFVFYPVENSNHTFSYRDAELGGYWVPMCQDKMICYSLRIGAYDTRMTCFYNNTELMEKYCGASP